MIRVTCFMLLISMTLVIAHRQQVPATAPASQPASQPATLPAIRFDAVDVYIDSGTFRGSQLRYPSLSRFSP